MPTRVKTNYEDVLLAVEAQLLAGSATAANFDPGAVKMGLDEDVGDLEPPADLFLLVTPGRLPLDLRAVAGGGNELQLVEATTKVYLWLRNFADQDGYDKVLLTDKAGGLFPTLKRVWKALSQFDPTNADGDWILAEPMRLLTPNVRPRRTGPAWVRLATEWQTHFVQDMT